MLKGDKADSNFSLTAQRLHEIVQNDVLQTALLHCAADMVTFAFYLQFRLGEMIEQLSGVGRSLALWEAVGHFWTHLMESDDQPIPPASIAAYLSYTRSILFSDY